ncbi:hypothetical protein [Mucilaginibacter sp.]|jgi:hypothetical protein
MDVKIADKMTPVVYDLFLAILPDRKWPLANGEINANKLRIGYCNNN